MGAQEQSSPATDPSGGTRRRAGLRWGLTGAAILGVAVAACGDDPFALDWEAQPDTVVLFSLARPELEVPSAFNFRLRQRVRIQDPTATGRWDVAVDTEGDRLVFLPPGAVGIESRAAITALPGLEFDEVEEAPEDTTVYSVETSVPIEMNAVYVVRTGESRDPFGRRCVFFAKLEPLEIDVEIGRLRFKFDANPLCNDRDLVPPDDD